MIRRAAPLLLALVLLASPALADESDAETRFHDAYVLEVIDGKIAEAAKAYLTLVRDEGTPMQVRWEAQFRFAICTVLLGRPDEGRIQLRAIVASERPTPELRERAKAYLESISALGVGTALEQKLQSLVFDLGRSSAGGDVAAYRDFEIIGEAAIPFLERLLRHEDVTLRRHAFRLLIRLGAEDLVAKWTPAIGFDGQHFNHDVTNGYLHGRPDEVARLEAKLLALDDKTLARALSGFAPYPSWSLEFVQALAAREALRYYGFAYLWRAGNRAEQWIFARACVLGEDENLRDAACDWAVDQALGPPDEMVEALWPPFLRRMAARKERWSARSSLGSRSGNLEAWADRVSTPLLLTSFQELVQLGEGWPAEEKGSPLRHGLASLLTEALAGREMDASQLDAYEALVKRWVLAVAPTLEPLQPNRTGNAGVSPLRNLLLRLPHARAVAFVEWLFEGPAHERAAWFESYLRVERPEDLQLLLAALRAVEPEQQPVLFRQLPRFTSTSPPPEIVRAEVELLPEFLRASPVVGIGERPGRYGVFHHYSQAAGRIPDDVLIDGIRELFRAAEEKEGGVQNLLDRLANFQVQVLQQQVAFFARYVLAALGPIWMEFDVPSRRHVLSKAMYALRHKYPITDDDLQRVAEVVLRAIDDVQDRDISILASRPDIFPVEQWLPWVAADAVNIHLPLRPRHVDPAMAVLTQDLTQVNQAVLNALRQFASPDVAAGVYDRMLSSDDPKIRDRAIYALKTVTGYPATPAGLEAALASLLAEEEPYLANVARIAHLLAKVQPSERLLPAAERLLAAQEKEDLVQGIALANRLGREALVPALAALLDSLDADLRDKARQAIKAIREVQRFKEEAQHPR